MVTNKDMIKCDDFVINISKFLSRYYNIKSVDAKRLSHDAFCEIFNLEAVSYLDIPVLSIIKGETILVIDTDEVIKGYKNPFINNKDDDIIIAEQVEEKSINLDIDNIYESLDLEDNCLTELSDYELDRLLYLSKKLRDEKTKNRVIKELKFRPESKPGAKQKVLEKVRKREFDREKGKGDLL